MARARAEELAFRAHQLAIGAHQRPSEVHQKHLQGHQETLSSKRPNKRPSETFSVTVRQSRIRNSHSDLSDRTEGSSSEARPRGRAYR